MTNESKLKECLEIEDIVLDLEKTILIYKQRYKHLYTEEVRALRTTHEKPYFAKYWWF